MNIEQGSEEFCQLLSDICSLKEWVIHVFLVNKL